MSDLLTISRTSYKVIDFISWAKKGSLILSPKFQRRPLWREGSKSFLIDTVYRGLPIPIIFLRDMGTNTNTLEPIREVIDGQQRLRTLISFIAPELLADFNPNRDDFTVSEAHNSVIANKKFKDLSEDDKQRIFNYEFSIDTIPQIIGDSDIIQIFRRMNSTNYSLSKQELLNAEFFGGFKTSQYLLAAEHLSRWREWKIFTDDEIARMHEVELISEISIAILENKINGKSPTRLKSFYQKYDEAYKNRQIVEDRVRHTMEFINVNFKGDKNDVVFFKKTIFYTFFMTCYSLLYGFDTAFKKGVKPKNINTRAINILKNKGEQIKERLAPTAVLEATDRRTTNIKERTTLYKYLMPKNA